MQLKITRRFSVPGYLNMLLLTCFSLLVTGIGPALAQVTGYSFSASAGTYTPVTGGTLIGAATNPSPNASSGNLGGGNVTVALPFSFTFNGLIFDSLRVDPNGWVGFGGNPLATTPAPFVSPLSHKGIICAFGHDLVGVFATRGVTTSGSNQVTAVGNTSRCKVGAAIQGDGIPAGTTITAFTANTITLSANATATTTAASPAFLSFTTGDIRMVVQGVAPNRTVVVQYTGMSKAAYSYSPEDHNTSMDFQIRLQETSNVVSMVYNNFLGNATANTAQVGLRGTSNADFNLRASTTSWNPTTAGTANTATLTWSASVAPANGLTYTWTLAACPGLNPPTFSGITATTATLNWTAPAAVPANGYEYYYSTSNTPPTTATVPSGATAAGVTTAALSLLTPNATTYYAWVRSVCSPTEKGAWSTMTGFATACLAFPVPFSQNFEGSAFVPNCWTRATGLLATPTAFTTPTDDLWSQQNYADLTVPVTASTNKAARLGLTSWDRKSWLITPSIDLGTIPRQLEFDIALTLGFNPAAATLGADDKVAVVISTDNGATWSAANTLRQWTSTTPIANGAGNHIIIDLTPYTGTVKIGFYGESTVINADNDLFIDNVSVITNPCPVVNLGPDITACNTGSFSQILDAGNPGATYLWNNGSTAQTRTVTAAGIYYVDVTRAGCTRRDSVLVTLNPLPVVNLGNDTAICSGRSVTLNAGNAGATYAWSNGATTQTITATTAGSYRVTVTGSNTCVGRDTLVLTVNPNPVVNLGNDTAICTGNTLILDAGNAGASYLWDNATTAATRSVNAAGQYYVAVTNTYNCTSRDTIALTLHALPVVALGNDTAICDGVVLTLDAGNAGATYQWDDNTTSQTRNVDTAGNYSVTVVDVHGCHNADTLTRSAIPPPSGDIDATHNGGGAYTFTVTSPQNVTSSSWNFGDGSAGSGTPVNHTYAANGDYTVTLVLKNACGDSLVITKPVKVDGVVGIDQLVLDQQQFSLYPNPASTVLNMINKSRLAMLHITIYNILGQIVYQAKPANAEHHQVPTATLAAGVYTLKVATAKGILVRKFEVVRNRD